jgi:hypothetical protein
VYVTAIYKRVYCFRFQAVNCRFSSALFHQICLQKQREVIQSHAIRKEGPLPQFGGGSGRGQKSKNVPAADAAGNE